MWDRSENRKRKRRLSQPTIACLSGILILTTIVLAGSLLVRRAIRNEQEDYLRAAIAECNESRGSGLLQTGIDPNGSVHLKHLTLARWAASDWLMNWYVVRKQGVTLFGPSPETLMDPTTKEEFIHAVREHAREWKERIKHARERKAQSYAMLTMCRALYAVAKEEQASNRQAAEW